MLEGVLDWGLRAAGLVLIAVTAYYIYATVMHAGELFRGVNPMGQPMTAQEFQRHRGNMDTLGKVLLLAAVGVAVCAIGRYYMYPETGMVLLVVGALLFFGVPFLIDSSGGVGTLPRQLAALGDPASFLKGRYVLAGAILGGAGAVHLICHGFLLVVNAKNRRPRANEEAAKTAAQVRKPNDQFFGPCWNLPFCRDTDKKLCPIRHSKKSCWRTGRGCYCDQNVILTLSGGQYNASRGTAGFLSHTATIARPKTLKEKREQCLQCPVYLHHQGQKYKVLAPLSIVAAIGAIAFYWDRVRTLYPDAMRSLGRSLSGFTFGGGEVGGVPPWAADLAGNQGMMWLLIIVGVILILAYLLHGIEWVLYRLGI
jgi:hypothetical protein